MTDKDRAIQEEHSFILFVTYRLHLPVFYMFLQRVLNG